MPRNTNARKRERSVSGLRNKMSELGVELDSSDTVSLECINANNLKYDTSYGIFFTISNYVFYSFFEIHVIFLNIAGTLPTICEPLKT